MALGTLVALWIVSVLSLGFSSRQVAECDPDCPMEIAKKNEMSYQGLEKKVVMLSGIVGWLSQYYQGNK